MAEKLRKSLLMIEDDPNDVALFRRAVRKLNLPIDLTAVEDGAAAIRWLQTTAETSTPEDPGWPRIILLDIKMPRVSGWEVLEWIRRQTAWRRTPVIAFTSSREGVDIARAYGLGVNSYLVKPVSFDNLKEIVRTLHHYWLDLNERPDIA
jgi:CheY-like chemotaxis protein